MWIRSRWLVLGALGVLLSAALVACGVAAPAPAEAMAPDTSVAVTTDSHEIVTDVGRDGYTVSASFASDDTLSELPASDLSDVEVEGLLYMREEEKLARDVYLMLYEKWGVPVFQNITNSEQTHMDAVKTLLDRYDIEDPVEGNDIGAFTDSTLQELYDQLVQQGSQSLADALRAGAAIEEIDILDLEERIAQTDQVDIQRVYDNLMKGSRNHLRAFASNLERRTGESYQPQYLSQTEYELIIDGSERGRGRSF
jgi:hypothetical protein